MTDSEKALRDLLARNFWKVEERDLLLDKAEIPIWRIDIAGSPLYQWHNIVKYASDQCIIDRLTTVAIEEKPKLALPLTSAKEGTNPRPTSEIKSPGKTSKVSHEAITAGSNTMLPIGFLRKGVECSRSVAKVCLSNRGSGTGFLLPGNWLITNNHVLPDANKAAKATAQFDYEEDENGVPQCPTVFHFDPSSNGFFTSVEDDWTAVRLKEDANSSYGALTFAEENLEINDFVNIIQHPDGNTKQIALYHNTVIKSPDRRLHYLTDTMPGSSGSPVFNTHWEIVALHHGSTLTDDPQPYTCNEGIPTAILLAALVEANVIKPS